MVESIVRGVLIQNGKLLVSKKHGEGYYALIGGHIEDERVRNALKREFREETSIKVNVGSFLYLIENVYQRKGNTHYEITFYFLVHSRGGNFRDRRPDATLEWKPIKKVKEIQLLPQTLKEFLVKDLNNSFQRRIHFLGDSRNDNDRVP